MVYLSDHGYDAEGESIKEIPAGGCSYIYLVGDFSLGRLPEEEQCDIERTRLSAPVVS